MRRILLLTLTIFVGIVFFVTSTELGLQSLVNVANKLLSQHLVIKNVQGNLSQLTASDIHYHDDNVDVQIDHIYLIWNPFALLEGRLRINTLLVNHPTVTVKESNSTSESSENPIFYLKYLQIHRLQVNKLVLMLPDSPAYIIKHTNLSSADFVHYQFSTDLFSGDTKGSFSLNWHHGLAWKISLISEVLDLHQANDGLIGKINMDVLASGQINGQANTWMVKLSQLDGEINHYPLAGRMDVAYQDKRLVVKEMDLKAANAFLRASGLLSLPSNSMISKNQQCQFNWELNIPNLHTLAPMARGVLKLKADLAGNCHQPKMIAVLDAHDVAVDDYKLTKLTGQLNLSLQNKSTVDLRGTKLDLNGYKLQSINLNGDIWQAEKALQSTWKIATDKQATLSASISLPHFTQLSDLSQPIVGTINLAPLALKQLGIQFPQIKALNGEVSAAVNIAGQLAKPVFTGGLSLKNGGLLIPTYGTRITQLNANATFDSHNNVDFEGSLRLGEGIARLTGNLNVTPQLKATLIVQGANLKILDSNEYKVLASPKLELNYSLTDLTVTGDIHIPGATIKPVNYVSVVTLPSDVVFVDQPKEESYLPRNLTLHVNVTLGKSISFKYQDLATEVSGGLLIYAVPNSELMAKGALNLEKGTYQAYGKSLTIQQGRLIYDGNLLTNPKLDIRAVKQIRTIAMSGSDKVMGNIESSYMGTEKVYVGVTVKGNAKEPLVKLYSSPGVMSQGDILSYLLFGYPQSELTGNNKMALVSALATLNLPGGGTSGITDSLKNIVGLSELSVGSTEVFDKEQNSVSSQTTFNVGKKLADNLFINYSLGLFSSVSIFSIRYQLTPRFAVQSEASSFETAGDLLYRYERD